MKQILLPKAYNYCGAFLTLRCNLRCSYCLNHVSKCADRPEMLASDWIEGLNRIQAREDLPISLQGGEPTLHPGFYRIVEGVNKPMDLLTNGIFNDGEFIVNVPPEKFKRNAPYASIRFSFHEKSNPRHLVELVAGLQGIGYQVGIWGLGDTPRNKEMAQACEEREIDFRIKEFLSDKSGTYKYPEAVARKERKSVLCKPSEMLIGPSGHIYRCHRDLYADENPIAHILDEDVKLPTDFLPCDNFGDCNFCDIKLKTNRFQQGGHCSVTIKELCEKKKSQ